MPRSTRLTTLVAASLLVVAVRADAQTIGAPTNGQEFGCRNPSNSNPFRCGQSFVAPAGSGVLESFTFTLRTTSSLVFELYAYTAPNVVGPALFTQALGPSAGGDFQSFVFAPAGGIATIGGASYVALVSVGQGEEAFFRATDANPYADGAALACSAAVVPSTCVVVLPAFDLAFSATFGVGAVTPVPEPATLALTGGGLLLLAGLARRRAAPR